MPVLENLEKLLESKFPSRQTTKKEVNMVSNMYELACVKMFLSTSFWAEKDL